MKQRRRPFFATLIAFGVFATPASGAGDSDPDRFMRHLYAPYRAGDASFYPTGKVAPLIFSPRLVRLIRLDAERARGEVGALDADPLCNCQDLYHFRLLAVQTLHSSATGAVMRVRIVNGGRVDVLTFWLVKGRRGWRVADVGSKGAPSLVALLRGGRGH